jgi:transcriptional regulator with XRE-family HTH domain
MPKHDKALSQFGRNVSRLRNVAALTQDKLAEKADLDRTYLSGIERGVRNPGIKPVIRIARALRVSIDQLCKGVEA